METGSRLLGFCTATGGWPNTFHAMLQCRAEDM